MLLVEKVKESIDFLNTRIGCSPGIAVILGSGLGEFAESIDDPVFIPGGEIPHYPRSTVPGHMGRWVVGRVSGIPTLAIQGRLHHYEGYTLGEVTYPVHLVANLGIKILIVTAASGSMNPDFHPGDLMLITDHINFTFKDPLRGHPENQLGSRFPPLDCAYDRELLALAEKVGEETKTTFRKGIFCWATGPCFETAAEIRMMRALGGDAVSMSTVPEVIVARQRHLRVLGISLITNMATGLTSELLSHDEVMEWAGRRGERLHELLRNIIKRIGAMNDPQDGSVPGWRVVQ